eukprot:RCo033724
MMIASSLFSRAVRRAAIFSPHRVRHASNLPAVPKTIFEAMSFPAPAKAHHGHHEGFVKMSEIKHLSDLVVTSHDSHLSEEALQEKVFLRLKELESEVYAKAARFNAYFGVKSAIPLPDPKLWPKKLADPLFLASLLCAVLFLIFLYNQYHEFAHEMSFEIRDGLMGFSFYFLLGLHGSHVIIGTGMLLLLTYFAWMQSLSGQSVFLRVTSIYVHLVDLVFVFIVFVVYGGQCSHVDEDMAEGKLPPQINRLLTTGADGKPVEEDLL